MLPRLRNPASTPISASLANTYFGQKVSKKLDSGHSGWWDEDGQVKI